MIANKLSMKPQMMGFRPIAVETGLIGTGPKRKKKCPLSKVFNQVLYVILILGFIIIHVLTKQEITTCKEESVPISLVTLLVRLAAFYVRFLTNLTQVMY